MISKMKYMITINVIKFVLKHLQEKACHLNSTCQILLVCAGRQLDNNCSFKYNVTTHMFLRLRGGVGCFCTSYHHKGLKSCPNVDKTTKKKKKKGKDMSNDSLI